MLQITRDILSIGIFQTGFAAAYLGAVFHVAISSYEVDFYIWRLIGCYIVLLASLTTLYSTVCSFELRESIARTAIFGICFNTGLTLSISVYRLFFHRLRKFPGPFLARLSRFYAVSLAAKDVQYYLEVGKMHEKYGDFVRTGPRELSVKRASAISALQGLQSECRKSPWYGHVTNDPTKASIHSTRDFEDHKRRKRAWDQAFSIKALDSLVPRVKSKVDIFISQMKNLAGRPVDATMWSMFWSFDTMGTVGLGTEFCMLEDGTEHSAIKALHDQLIVIGIMSPVPWLLSMLRVIPGAASGYAPFFDWCEKQSKAKEKTFDPEKDPSDIFSWLLKAKADKSRSAPHPDALSEEGRLIVIAGSDTSAITLSHAFYYLIKYPHTFQKLQSIMDSICHKGQEDWTYDKVKALPYLEGIIQETLRLKPAVPGGVGRTTPKAGIYIDEMYIPGDTVVFAPTYLIQRDARNFEDPEVFYPERWVDDEVLMMDKSAYAPFSIGGYGCVGKNLALMELRIMISLVALNFDIGFAPGEDGINFDTKASDTFTFTLPPLKVVFKERTRN